MDLIMPQPRKGIADSYDFPIDLNPPSPKKWAIRPGQCPELECILHRMPFEIREKIFHLTLEWTGKSPAMLVALRQEPELYKQALKVFYKTNIFTAKGLEKSCNMPLSVIEAIERLSLEVSKEYFHPLAYELSHYEIGPNHWKVAQSWSMNLTELRLTVDFDYPKLIQNLLSSSPFTDGALFPKLNRLAFSNVVSDKCIREKGGFVQVATESFVAGMNKKLGVKGMLESVLEATPQKSPFAAATGEWALVNDIWFWQAPPKKTFANWAWEQGKLEKLAPESVGWRRLTL